MITTVLKKMFFLTIVCACIVSFNACGQDSTSAIGDKGNLVYSLTTDYYVNSNMNTALFATKMTHEITVGLNNHEIKNPSTITHSIENNSASVIITNLSVNPDICSSCVTGIAIKASTPGEYKIVSSQGATVIDTITIKFDVATSLDIVTKTRKPYEDNFIKQVGSPVTVAEGAQVAFVAIPMNSAGTRLASNGDYRATANPTWMVVPGKNVSEQYEEDGWSWSGDENFYFIEPGNVTFTITEVESGYVGTQSFTVNPVSMVK